MDAITLHDLSKILERRQSPPGPAGQPIVLVDLEDLESLPPDQTRLLARRLPDDLRVYVGVRTSPLAAPLIGPGQEVLERLTTTVGPTAATASLPGPVPQGLASATSAVVRVADPERQALRIVEQAQQTPGAVHMLDTMLRIAERATPRETLIIESNAYTNLLNGPEYARWRRLNQLGTTGPPAEVTSDIVAEPDTGAECCVITVRWTTPDSGMDHDLRLLVAKALTDARSRGVRRIELRADGPDFCAQGIPDDDRSPDPDRNAYLIRLRQHPGVAGWLVHRRLTAAVHGDTSSAGLELASFATTLTAAPDSRFSVPHVRFGLVFGAGGTVSVTRRIGRWRTAYLALTGEQIDAATALRWGLIDSIVDEAAETRARPELVGAPG